MVAVVGNGPFPGSSVARVDGITVGRNAENELEVLSVPVDGLPSNVALLDAVQVWSATQTFDDVVINGTSTTVNSTVVDIADRVIHVNNSSGDDDPVPALVTGMSVHRGAVGGVFRDHASIMWDEPNSRWKLAFNTEGDDMSLGSYLDLQLDDLFAARVAINVASFSGSEKLRVSGDARIEGKLTVTGSLDPTDLVLSGGGTAHFVQFGAGETAPVSASGTARLVFDETAGTMKVSVSGGAYSQVGSVTGSGTSGKVPKFSGTQSLADSAISDDGTTVTVSTRLSCSGGFTGTERFGDLAGIALTTGTYNSFFGNSAGTACTTVIGNTGLGASALATCTTGGNNTAVGAFSLFLLTSGARNTAVGYRAGESLTTGVDNTCLGQLAGFASVVAVGCTFCGQSAGVANTGDWNTHVGSIAGFNATSGKNNTFVGRACGVGSTTGSDNVLVGSFTNSSGSTIGSAAAALSSTVALGARLNVQFSSSVVLGTEAANSAANQFVAGSVAHPANEVFFGKGPVSTSPTGYRIKGTAGSGTNVAGGLLTIDGGRSTGSASGGVIGFTTSPPGASGTTLNALVTRLEIDDKGNVFIGSAALATTATDGFLYIPTCPGAPTGVPTVATGRVPMVVDDTSVVKKFYVYVAGVWKSANLV